MTDLSWLIFYGNLRDLHFAGELANDENYYYNFSYVKFFIFI